jgi:hypothetical protein
MNEFLPAVAPVFVAQRDRVSSKFLCEKAAPLVPAP